MRIQVFKLLLVMTNCGVLFCLVAMIVNHIRCQYNLKSFSFLFYMLSFVWLLIRGIFWISTLTSSVEWTSAQYYFLYWMPVPIEFGSFMLLPLYFVQVIYPEEWKTYYSTGRRLYIGIIFGLIVVQIIYIMMELVYENEVTRECHGHKCIETDPPNLAFRAITASCFLLLSAGLYVYASQLNTVVKHRYDRFLSYPSEVMDKVNIVLFCSFFSRALYQLLAFAGLSVLPDVPLSVDGDATLLIFLVFELWDYVPTILLISTITSGSFGTVQSQRNTNISETSQRLLGLHMNYSSMNEFNKTIELSQLQDELQQQQHHRHNRHHNNNQYNEEETGLLNSDSSTTILTDNIELGGVSNSEGVFPGSRRNSHTRKSSRDIAFEREPMLQDPTANLLFNRYMNPQSLERNDSSLLTNDSSRYWRNNPSPAGSGSRSGSYTGNGGSTAGISTYASRHSADPQALYIPGQGRAPVGDLGSHSGGSSTGSHHHHQQQYHQQQQLSGISPQQGPSGGTAGGTSVPTSVSTNGSLLERNESLVAYYARHRRSGSYGTYESITSEDSSSPRPHLLATRLTTVIPPAGYHTVPITTTAGVGSARPPVIPSMSNNTSPSHSNSAKAINFPPIPPSGNYDSALPAALRAGTPQSMSRDSPDSTAETEDNTTTAAFLLSPPPTSRSQASTHSSSSIANEWQVEPNSNSTAKLPHTQAPVPVRPTGPDGSVKRASPLNQQQQQPQLVGLAVSPSWYHNSQVQLLMTTTSPSNRTALSQQQQQQQQQQTGYTTTSSHVMVPVQVAISPLQMVPVYMPATYGSNPTDTSVGSLTFSNHDSPCLQGLDVLHTSGPNTYAYLYDDPQYTGGSSYGTSISNYSEGIGISRPNSTAVPSNNNQFYTSPVTVSVASSTNNTNNNTNTGIVGTSTTEMTDAGIVRTVYPRPKRVSGDVRAACSRLGLASPPQLGTAVGEDRDRGNETGGGMHASDSFDREVGSNSNSSFSPSFMTSLENNRQEYLYTAADQHQSDLYRHAYHNHASLAGLPQPPTLISTQPYTTTGTTSSNSNKRSSGGGVISTPERQEAARENARIREHQHEYNEQQQHSHQRRPY